MKELLLNCVLPPPEQYLNIPSLPIPCIYGIVSINNERAGITVNSISLSENILPVHLLAYDIDGISGRMLTFIVGKRKEDLPFLWVNFVM